MKIARWAQIAGILVVVFCSLVGADAYAYSPSWDQDRQMNATCSGYAVGGYSKICGTSLCLTETTPSAGGPPRVEHVWVFQNIPAGQYCLNVSGSVGAGDTELFQFLWRTFTPGDQTESYLYTSINNAINDLSGAPFKCGLTTTNATKDIHIIVEDQGGAGDTTTSTITIDSITLTSCNFAANYCEQL